jgi:hypothetical protein
MRIEETEYKWPKGKHTKKFTKDILENVDAIKHGSMLSVDPGTNSLGWALFQSGILVQSGEIKATERKTTVIRLREILHDMYDRFEDNTIDLMVVEMLRGNRVRPPLHWATGTVLAAIQPDSLIEVPIVFWHKIRPVEYVKTDELDAKLIGRCVCLVQQDIEKGKML